MTATASPPAAPAAAAGGAARAVPADLLWPAVRSRCQAVAPEGFPGTSLANYWGGHWRRGSTPFAVHSPVDGSFLLELPMIEPAEAVAAVAAAAQDHEAWLKVDLDERRRRVTDAVEAMAEHRDLLAQVLAWEIGKPWSLACDDVDRCLDGVRWYVDEIEGMLAGRRPLPGPVSNIASWNYPMSVLAHAMLVQMLAGNAVLAKTPTDGGAACVTLAVALMVRSGLPVTLVSGHGARLSTPLVRSPEVGAVAFVGGRSVGGQIATALHDDGKRHMLEQEGLNAWGVWEFSDWDALAAQVRKSFAYGKQRCTAYPRFVVQRALFDKFLEAYLPAVRSIRFGHPLAVAPGEESLPTLDFGPLINAEKVAELEVTIGEAIAKGGIPLYRGSLDDGLFVPGQDTSSYLAPYAILEPPASSALRHAEPFGPVDTIVVVDTEAELLAEMNASNGALVASLACDDEALARRLAGELHAFKVGINKPRSRGDRDEPFGGRGASWKGAFVGGELLVQGVTEGEPGERLYGNFPTYSLYPESAGLG